MYDNRTIADKVRSDLISRRHVVIVDNPFNRHWYRDIIGCVYTTSKCPPYANFAWFNCYIEGE